MVFTIVILCLAVNPLESIAASLPGPVVLNPVNGSFYNKGDMTLSWNSVPGAQNYTLAVRDLTTNTLIVPATNTVNLNYTVKAELFTAGHQYKFAVGANASGSTTGWTEVVFNISSIISLPGPAVICPNGNSTYDKGDMTLSWNSVPGAQNYTLAVRDLTTNTLIVPATNTVNLNYTVKAELFTAGHQYKFAVGANASGSTTGWTEVIFNISSLINGERIGNPITLSSQEGSAAGDVNINVSKTTRHYISSNIPGGKMVVVSLSGVNDGNVFTAKLYNSETGQEVSSYSGGWYGLTKMKYYKTSSLNASYYVSVSSQVSGTYNVNVAVLNTASFSKLDTKENASSNRTYCISNSPENLNSNYYKGEYGYYLQRSVIQGNANIYYEHSNTIGYTMKFGVLLYNTNSSSVTVTINRRSYATRAQSATAMMDVWTDWFNKTIKPDQSGVTSSVTIPPNEGRWICLHDVENGSNMPWGLFNGVIDVSIPTGSSLYCDTYFITQGTSTNGLTYVENTRRIAAITKQAVCKDNLRGSGEGAILKSDIPGVTSIFPNDPFKLAITGFDPPALNAGERIPIYDYLGNKTQDNCCNYSVVYKLNFNSFSSTGIIKGQVKYSPKINPNYLASDNGGIYVIVQKKVGNTSYPPYKVLLTNSANIGTFDSNVPQGTPVTYYIVASGMSSMPLEVDFVN